MKTKQQKHNEAIERNKIWNSFTKEQKITFLLNRPGNCTKQLAKLHQE